MVKKNKDQEPTATLNAVTNRDILQRLNFLYQASAYLNTIAPHATTVDPEKSELLGTRVERNAQKSRLRRKKRHPATTSDLSRTYATAMKAISQKVTVKMDPAVKRTICQKCNTVLVPGATEEVRIRASRVHGNIVAHGCMTCGFVRRIPAPPILDPDAPPDSTSAPANSVQPRHVDAGNEAMNTDPAPGHATEVRKRKRKGPRPRLPPLFQRKGHAVFRGDERIYTEELT